jgi:endo-1,4-beta-xylanase
MKIKHIALLLLIVFAFSGCEEEIGDDHITVLPPLKDDFTGKFMIGNIFNPSDVSSSAVTDKALLRHYNVLTPENNLKPDQLSSAKGSYNFSTADRMVNAAIASGFKVEGHTLLWHSQIPQWQKNIASASKESALSDMRKYITDVVGHFHGKIYAWDVLNEAFPDGGYSSDWKTSMRRENPWYSAIGSDFVYEGFLAARHADSGVILYYNDYNTDMAGKARMIHDMVRDVNLRYKTEYPDETRLLIEGIGMQEHHNTGVSASSIKNTLNLFKPLGVRVAVSELDVLIVTYQEFAPYGHGSNKQGSISGDKKTNGLKKQAELYSQYFKVYLEFSDIIERVTFWGVTDDKSWRSAGLPLIFSSGGKAKAAYYSVIESLK